MNRAATVLVVVVLVLALAACAGGAGSGGGASSGNYNTDFPLPASVSDFRDMGRGSVNFQTKLSVEECVAFYRDALTEAGMTERSINTSITDTTFSMVFDGDPSGKAVVVQGVDLGNGSTNVNIRYEEV